MTDRPDAGWVADADPVSSRATVTAGKKRVNSGMWGPAETLVVGFALVLVVLVVLFYLLIVIPSQGEYQTNRVRRGELSDQLAEAKKKFGSIEGTEKQVARLVSSAEDFEVRFLQDEANGKASIYRRLNELISSYSLVNTAGPDYTSIRISEDERRAGARVTENRGRSRFQSLFPGVYITLTVEGGYQNLRRFISALENSSEFMTISALELEPAENDSAGPTAPSGSESTDAAGNRETERQGRIRGKTVSLRIEMAAYFRRPNEDRLLTSLVDPEG